MRRAIVLGLVTVAGSAYAQPDGTVPADVQPPPVAPPPGPTKPKTETEIVAPPKVTAEAKKDPRKTAVPTFELTGKSEGESTVKLGVDLLLPFANRINELRLRASFQAASHDGVTTLLSGDSAGFQTESNVGMSLDVTYTTLQSRPGIAPGQIDALSIGERRKLLRECRESGFAVTADLTNDRAVDEIDPGAYCDDAQKKLAAAENEEKLPLPRRQLTFSFAVARSQFRQLSPTGEDDQLAVTTRKKPSFSMAIGYGAFAPAERLSFELATRLDSAFEATGRKARFCVPVGSVGTNPAESCAELPLGDPIRTTTLGAAAYLGFVSDDYNWRIAAGPTTRFGFGGDKVSYEIGFELPFYLVRATAGFSGIVRVAPAALLTRDASGVEDSKVLLTLTLLGNRTLFDTAFR